MGFASRWLNAECRVTAAQSPGRKASMCASGRFSATATETIAKIAVAPPCMIAVPNPRTISTATFASGRDAR